MRSRNSMTEDAGERHTQRPGGDQTPPPALDGGRGGGVGAEGPEQGDSAWCSTAAADDVGDVEDEDPFGEAGQCCSICAAETRCNRHLSSRAGK
jgi:hypothetical protein